jgi:molecular chaperone DnaK
VPPGSRRDGDRTAIGLLVKLTHTNVEEFVEKYATNLSRGGLFIRSRDPKPVGTPVRFELRLANGEKVIQGEGVVRWIQQEDPNATPPVAPGMGIQFTNLDAASAKIVERMITAQERRGLAPRSPPTLAPGPPTLSPTTPPPVPLAPSVPPVVARAPAGPAQADLSAAHKIQQISAGPVRVDIGVPKEPPQPRPPSKAIIGIDLGTTNSCAAVVKDGKPYVIPSREGYNIVPSIVGLNARNQIMVGHLARSQLLTSPQNTVHGAKRLVGRPFHSPVVQELKSKFAYEIVEGEGGMSAVKLGPETLTLEQVSALVLREVKELAQSHLNEEVNRAVITVPAYYSERQRAAVRTAGALAGLQVQRILNEPTSAALAYAFGRQVRQRILVYDLGGGTFDASVLELQDNVYEVVSTGGDTFLGGVDFDNRIVDHLLTVYQKEVGRPFDGDRVARSRLTDAAERAKCALSASTEFRIQLPYLTTKDGQPVGLETTLTRDQIVGLVEPLVDRTLAVCAEVLGSKGLQKTDIDEVILVGGQSRMPLVREKVSAFFGKKLINAVHPDEAVAIGAALLARSLDSAEGVVLIDVLPMSIGIGLPGGKVKTIIERNTPLPARKQYGLSTTQDGQTEFELVVVQGEGDSIADCEYLGTLTLGGLPKGPRGMVKIAVTFELGAECLLTVKARELNTGKQVSTTLSTRDAPDTVRRKLAAAAGESGAAARTSEHTMPGRPIPNGHGGVIGFFKRLFGGGKPPPQARS